MYLLLFEALLYNKWWLNLMHLLRTPVCVNTFRDVMAVQSMVRARILLNSWEWKEMPEIRKSFSSLLICN